MTLTISAVVASVRMIAPLTNARYRSAAFSAHVGREATGQSVVLLELDEDAPGQHALGTVRDEEVFARDEARLREDRRKHVARGARWDGRLEDDQVAAAQEGQDVARGLLDEAQVGPPRMFVERRRNGDDEGVGQRRLASAPVSRPDLMAAVTSVCSSGSSSETVPNAGPPGRAGWGRRR